MSIQVTCPAGHTFRAKSGYAGRTGRCPECGATVVVPREETRLWRTGATPQATPTPAADADALKQRALGRFQLKAVLGRGGFGTVYRAHDPQLDREVALKVPRGDTLADKGDAERFFREARAAGQLRHPHIVPVYDAGCVGETYYIASGYVEGPTLQAVLEERGRFSPVEAVRLVASLADALDYAHSRGIVHRDIKPANIILDEHGQPHVTDFGLARRLDAQSLHTVEGARLGTPAYMSPEQAEGHSHKADARTDVWSLGVVLYELLTGQRPFEGGGEIDTLLAIQTREPAAPRSFNSALSRDLETICLRCLVKAPGGRYPSCRELHDELSRWLRGEPIHARHVGPLERSWRWARRNRTVAALGSAVLVVSVSFAVVSTVMLVRLSRQQGATSRALARERGETRRAEQAVAALQREIAARATAEAQRAAAEAQRVAELEGRLAAERERAALAEQLLAAGRTAEAEQAARAQAQQALLQAETEAAEARQRADLLLASGRIAEAQQAVAAGDLARAEELLSACPEAARSWEWSHLMLRCRGGLAEWEVPQGRRGSEMDLEFVGGGQTLLAWSISAADSREIAKLWDATEVSTRPLWSGDRWLAMEISGAGRRAAVVGANQLDVLDLVTGQVAASTPAPEGGFELVGFGDEPLVVAVIHKRMVEKDWDSRLSVWDLSTGAARWTAPAWRAVLGPDGRHIALEEQQVAWRIHATGSGDVLLTWPVQRGVFDYDSVWFTPDGRRVIHRGEVWDLATRQRVAALPEEADLDGYGSRVAFSPDGGRLWVGDDAGGCTAFDLASGEAGCRLILREGQADKREDDVPAPGPLADLLGGRPELMLVEAPDGRLAAVHDEDRVHVFDTASAARLFDCAGIDCFFTSDGRRLAVLQSDGAAGRITLFETDTFQPAFTLAPVYDAMAVSPDGSRIAASTPRGSVKLWQATAPEELAGALGE